MKKSGLTFTLHVGGTQIDKLSADQVQRIADRLSETMSTYYTAHPEEFKKLREVENHD